MGIEVNWFVNSDCNLTCGYCFRERDIEERGTSEMIKLANYMADEGVDRVTIGGGEPLLREDLEQILLVLKERGVFVSLHTNGTILKDRIEGLVGLVDILSLPIDSVDERQNRLMRSRPYVNLIREIIEYSIPLGFKIAFKTTATSVNRDGILGIYDLIKDVDPVYWKVYQFRPLNRGKREISLFSLSDEEFRKLRGELDTLKEPWINVIDRIQGHQPYIFLDNMGGISTIDPVVEENIPVGLGYNPRISIARDYIQALHGGSKYLPEVTRAYGRFLSPNSWVTYSEQDTHGLNDALRVINLVYGASDPTRFMRDLFSGLSSLVKGKITIRIATANNPQDLLDENCF